MKKIVSCFLAIVFVMHCATFSSYSVPTSSVPTSSVPFAGEFLDDVNPDQEAFPELSGGDGEGQYCIEVPEVIEFYTNTYDMKTQSAAINYKFYETCTISCTNVTDGYGVVVCPDYEPAVGSGKTSNVFSIRGDDDSFTFKSKGKVQIDCSLSLRRALFDLEEDEEKEFGVLVYWIECIPV